MTPLKVPFAALLIVFLIFNTADAAYENYHNVLVGSKGVGFGGAQAAVIGDPSSSSFYNPATLSRIRGTSLSTSVSLYNKYDTGYGSANLEQAPLKVNQGFFRSLPSTGTLMNFGNYAFGLSVVIPDYDNFSGEIESSVTSSSSTTTLLNLADESLWVGGSFAMNFSENSSWGVTAYYTARNFQRTLVDQTVSTTSQIYSEEKSFTNNSVVYQLGFYSKLSDRWGVGASYRLPSIEVSGRGYYYRSYLDTSSSTTPTVVRQQDVGSEGRIPSRIVLGVNYKVEELLSIAFDVHRYLPEDFADMESAAGQYRVRHVEVTSFHFGTEYSFASWIKGRLGLFTNPSSTPLIGSTNEKMGDHIDMWGWSAQVELLTSEKTSVGFGGYYTGGTGEAVEQINQVLTKKTKSKQVFSMMITTEFFL
ncbi:MAG: hypothetical protein COT74_13660 [Bdellovibrionales bacterium CG10_big_fil_rev_8_21_14_0_10_45_34]|nr:MAG: hypothetical protein COT74_13660 [Bdellovibrionales bacterium CG10_big_fil_rev_8_21_14_0_10_45_34]